jgi:hypothetical protein
MTQANDQAWLTCQQIATWAAAVFNRPVPVRTVQGWTRADPHPLPHVRLGKRILVRPMDLREWVAQRRGTS